MRNWLIQSTFAVEAMLLAVAVAIGQSAARPKSNTASTPDLSGIWISRYQPRDLKNPTGLGTAGGINWGKPRQSGGWGFLDYSMEQPSMQPWAEERFKKIREGSPDPYLQPTKEVEPSINCIPSNMPWVYDTGSAFQIIQLKNKIVMLFEEGDQWRQIYLDGRKNPEGAPDAFMGYSTGKWDGDTLVVETVGISDITWIDRIGHFHSDALRVEERIRRPTHDRLEIDFLFDDSKTYTKPWKGKKILLLQPNGNLTENFPCEEKLREEYSNKLQKELGGEKTP